MVTLMVIGISVLITACGYDSRVKCTAVAWFISLICGICDWPLAELRNGSLRLAAGGHSVSSGFLEMYYDSQWGSICSEGWDSVDTSVACSQLGFPDTNSVAFNVSARNTAASQPVHSSNVQCDGTESSIFACSQDPIGTNTCDLSNVVVVMCDASSYSALGKGIIYIILYYIQ